MLASYVFVALAGFLFGSALNSYILHCFQKEDSVVHSHSHKMFFRQPLVAFLYSLLFILVYYRFGFSIDLAEYGIMVFILIAVAVIDLKTMEIPDKIICFGFVAASFFTLIRIIFFKESLFIHFSGFLAGGGVFLLIALITKAMGGGDIKLMALLGLWMGLRSIFMTVFLSFFIAAIISVILLITGKKGRKDYIPFAPFISAAAFMVSVFEEELLQVWFLIL